MMDNADDAGDDFAPLLLSSNTTRSSSALTHHDDSSKSSTRILQTRRQVQEEQQRKRNYRQQSFRKNNKYSLSVHRRANYLSTASEEMKNLLKDNDDDEEEDITTTSNSSMITNEFNPLLPRRRINDKRQHQFISPAALESMRRRAKQQRYHYREEEEVPYPTNNRATGGTKIIESSSSHDRSTCTGCACIQCIRTTETGVREYFGEFYDLIGPGWYCTLPPCFRIVSRVSFRVQQLEITVSDCKTKDSVFLPAIRLALQYRAIDAYRVQYRTLHTHSLIQSLVRDIVRSTVAELSVDRLFVSETAIWTEKVHERLVRPMEDFGYELDTIPLVVQLTVDPIVRTSMNDANACKRLKDASSHKAEAYKVQRIKQAQAEAERSYLEGVGLARARRAIVDGMKTTLQENEQQQQQQRRQHKEEEMMTCNNQDILNILLVSQYMDTLSGLGRTTAGCDSNNMVVCSDPSQVKLLSQQLSIPEEEKQVVLTQDEIDMQLLEKVTSNEINY